MKVTYTDVLIIGGGLAGLRIGIAAKRRGHDVIILSLVPPKRSHSCAAQGGMQASLANVIKGQGGQRRCAFRRYGSRQRLGRRPASRKDVC
jgi:fumarate reductase flavoprotein subunit